MPVGYLKHFSDLTQWFLDKGGKKRWVAWELSNVGTLSRIETPGSGTCRIESVLVSHSASACSGAVKISTATRRDGLLGMGLSWQKGVVEDDMVKALMGNMTELVEQYTTN